MDNSLPNPTIKSWQSSLQSNSTIKILIVDDAEIDRFSYKRYLQADPEQQYHITEAETLEEGLELWRSQQPDVVLLDINLPDGDGLEFLEAISTGQLINKLPVIMLTGQGDERIAVRAMKLGAADYLVKSDVTDISLLTCINQVQENNILLRQLRRSQQQQTIIASMALHIRRSVAFEDVSNAIVQEIRSFLAADRTIIYRFHPDMSGAIVAEAVLPEWESCLDSQIEDTCFQENLGGEYQNGKIFAANDIYEANLTECHIQLLERYQIRANLVVPILLNGTNTLWGLLIVHQCSSPRQWQEEDIQLLHQLSVHLAISLQQAELYQNLENLNSSLEAKVQERTEEIQLQAQMLEQIHDAVISTTPDGTILTWNTGAEQLYEYKANEAIGQNISILYLNEDVPFMQSTVFVPVIEKGIHEVEQQNRTKSGNIIDISLRLSLVRDALGNPIRLIGCSNDISDRKKAEESLLKSEAESRAILAAIPDLMFRIGADQVYREMVTPYREVAIFPRDFDLVGRSATDLLPPELAQQQFHYIQQTLQTGELQVYEQQVQNGARIQFEEVRIVKSGEDEALFMIRDISDRKLAELELQQLNQELEAKVDQRTAQLQQISKRLTLALKSGEFGCWQWDLVRNTKVWDERMYELYGMPKQAGGYICYDDWANRLHSEDRDSIESFLQQALSGEVEYDTEFRVVHPDGTVHFIKAYGAVVRDEQGNPQAMIGINFDISDRKRIESALMESEAKFRRLVEGANDVIWSTDTHGIFNYLSPQFQTIFGFEPSDWIGKNAIEFVHPEDRDWVISEQMRSIQSEQKVNYIEFRHRHHDGHYIWVSANSTPIINADNITIGLQGILTDISDRKKAEQEILENHRFIKQIADSSPNVLYLYDLQEQRNTYVNREILATLGYSAISIQEMGASWLPTIIHPDDLLSTLEHFERLKLANDSEILSHEYRLRHADGEWRYFYSRDLIFSRDAEGQVKIIIGTAQDITDRKYAEAALRASDQRWQFALESAGDGIWDWNVQTNEVFFSQQWKALLGYADDEIENKFESWENLVHPNDIAQCYKDIDKCLKHETLLYENEHRLRCKDGSYKWILARGKVFEVNADGQALRMMGTHTDLSDRKQAEAQLQQINNELLHATKLKDEFLANMSHELRTPLNAILGMSESLMDQVLGSINERQQKAIGIIEKSGRHLLDLINDILDLSKIASGKMELNCTSTAIDNLCSSSVTFVRQQAFQKNIQIITNIPPNLNALNVDERRIKQVLINLLTNAVKFTPNGGQITFSVTVGYGNTWLGELQVPNQIRTENLPMILFQVTDTGIGIATKDLSRLFQPFVQVDSNLNRQYEGTGLGLAMVKQVVELHGGQVTVESQLGQGSCFTVALPYEMSDSPTLDTSTELITTPVVASSENAIAPLILLAEDNEANVSNFTIYLTALNYRLIVANNGQEAIALAKSEKPDIILMDIQMPIMDGLEATRLIRADADIADIPILALTALAMEGDETRCLEAGANEYLSKPVRLKQLANKIAEILAPS